MLFRSLLIDVADLSQEPIINGPEAAPPAQELLPDLVRCANRREFPSLLNQQTWRTLWGRLKLKTDFTDSEENQRTT